MQIQKGISVAVVVKRTWANLHGVKMFLRQSDNPQTEIRGVDESHIIFATVLDAEDVRGIWIERHVDLPKQEPPVERFQILIPWSQVLAIVTADQFSAEIRQEARRIGFTGETEPE